MTGSIFDLFQEQPENLSLIKDIVNKASYYRLSFRLNRILNSVSLEAITQEPVIYLLYAGYLTFALEKSNSPDTALIKIPNEEVRSNFLESLYRSISSSSNFSNEVQKCFLSKEITKIEECLIMIFMEGFQQAQQKSPKKFKETNCPLEIYINNEVWRMLKGMLNNNFMVESQIELDIIDDMNDIKIKKPDIVIMPNSKNQHLPVYLIENMIIDNDNQRELEKAIQIKKKERMHEYGDYQKETIIFWVGVNKLGQGNRVIVQTEVIEKQLK